MIFRSNIYLDFLENLPEKNDASRLVYCAATVQEVQRFSSAIPIAIPHTATKDLVLEGYSIKKDNRIIINLQKIMKDHRVFKNPDEFNPERFIENDLKTGERKLKVLMKKIIQIQTHTFSLF